MEIIHDTKNNEFILPLENNLSAKVVYTLDSCNGMRLIHSEVPYELRGQGIGKELVLKTFQKLTDEGFEATAVCSYIRATARRDEKWKTIIKH
jgi:predicted GNAT family acetyltransferase